MKRAVLFIAVVLIAASLFAGEVVKRGAPLSSAKATPLSDVLAKPEAFEGKTILVEGVVSANCTEMGCWMQLSPSGSKEKIHVTFKDGAFFIPTDSKGMRARAEGVTTVQKISKEEADHLAGEGAQFTRNPDGSVTQVSFVASGVELEK